MKAVVPAEVWLVEVVDLLQSCHSKHMSRVQIDTNEVNHISFEYGLAASKVCTGLVQ